ncbi:MAG: helix-turn-helix transcriptional regulator [Phycisphaerales bacterium]|nr:helix-turn-helix transcriptional regulator [Phycisphaerales bacterium]
MEPLSAQIARLCRESGFSNAELARAIGMDKAAFGRVLNGERGFSADKLDRLGGVLGLRLVRKAEAGEKREAA